MAFSYIHFLFSLLAKVNSSFYGYEVSGLNLPFSCSY